MTDSFKVVVLGESAVGKTSLSTTFIKGRCNRTANSTIDASFQTKKVMVGERTIGLNIWDTAG